MALTIRTRSERAIWAEYGPGVRMRLRLLTSRELLRLEAQARRESRGSEDELGIWPGMARQLARHAVLDWEIDGAALERLVEVEDCPSGPLPYSAEDCATLLSHSLDLYTWVRDLASDRAAHLAAQQEAARKNSSPGPAAGSAQANTGP